VYLSAPANEPVIGVMMKRFNVRSLAAVAVLAPALACAPRSATVGSPAPGTAAANNTRTIGSVGAPVGLQLWSLRSMSKDPAAMFALARSMGVTHVETAGLYGMTPEQFSAGLKAADLRATSMHIGLDEFKKNPQNVIGTAKALGVKYVGTAWYPHQGAFTEADARKAIADFNEIGKTMKAAGLQFFYHNHGYEPVAFGDGTLLELMIRETDPELVKFEMDVLWTFLPNVDPAALIRK
jgi:sugar phosphate isomerase/epimerase